MSSHCNESTIVHEGRVFALHHDRVTLPNGVDATLDVIRHPGAAAIVPVTEQGRVVLIRQFRYAVGGSIWEIPAGTLDPRESPLNCAKRELVEEIGYSASGWQQLGTITPLPGCSDERIHIFLASDLTPAEQDLDDDEMLKVHTVKLDAALQMILTGEISDGKTISGLFLASNCLKDKHADMDY